MSARERAMGEVIWQSCLRHATVGEGVWRGVFFVRDIAADTGVSKPTAQKYLDILAENGDIECWWAGGNSTKQFRIRS